jgi:hypothetical protein
MRYPILGVTRQNVVEKSAQAGTVHQTHWTDLNEVGRIWGSVGAPTRQIYRTALAKNIRSG